jgi:hypothetical protein
MRLPLRILVNAATVLSLLLCVAAVALWILSYAVAESGLTPDGRAKPMCSFAGGLWYQVDQQWPDLSNMRDDVGEVEPEYNWSVMGLVHSAGREGRIDVNQGLLFSTYCKRWRVPYGFIASLAVALPLLRYVRWIVIRPTRGFCPTCGYNLRATPYLCPECGTAPTAQRGGPEDS